MILTLTWPLRWSLAGRRWISSKTSLRSCCNKRNQQRSQTHLLTWRPGGSVVGYKNSAILQSTLSLEVYSAKYYVMCNSTVIYVPKYRKSLTQYKALLVAYTSERVKNCVPYTRGEADLHTGTKPLSWMCNTALLSTITYLCMTVGSKLRLSYSTKYISFNILLKR